MKHIYYKRKQTGECYFEDTTIFLSETEEEYNKTKEKYASFPEFEDNMTLKFQGGELEGFSFTERSITQKLTTIILK